MGFADGKAGPRATYSNKESEGAVNIATVGALLPKTYDAAINASPTIRDVAPRGDFEKALKDFTFNLTLMTVAGGSFKEDAFKKDALNALRHHVDASAVRLEDALAKGGIDDGLDLIHKKIAPAIEKGVEKELDSRTP